MNRNNQQNFYKIVYNSNGGALETNDFVINNILLDGTSSSGKSSICKFLSKELDYICHEVDAVWNNSTFQKFYGKEYNKLPNKYVTEEFKNNVSQIIIARFILQISQQNPKNLID